MGYTPPFTVTDRISTLCIEIAEMVGHLDASSELSTDPVLHRELRIRTIHSSLAIENNQLSERQVTALLDGKRVLGPAQDIMEVENAHRAYALIDTLDPYDLADLLRAHGTMMAGLREDAGRFRDGNVGVYDGDRLIHAGTPAAYVPEVMADLFSWLRSTEMHPLIASCVFHYEFEFIHPFSDGNGRTGRLWHTLLLSRWRRVLAWLPVESVILQRQSGYYAAINQANGEGASTVFVEFMLTVIRDAVAPYAVTSHAVGRAEADIVADLMRDAPTLTVKDISERTGMPRRSVERLIARMKDNGLVRREGSSRSGRWVVS